MKLRPPLTRGGLIQRDQIVKTLLDARQTPVIAIVAPPGYGKTTLLSQLHAGLDLPGAWLTLDESDSDPAILLQSLIDSLSSAGLLSEDFESSSAIDPFTTGINALARRIGPKKGVLLIDQVDHLRSRDALDVVGAVMTRLSPSLQVIVASRSGRGLPLALIRSRGDLLELSSSELAMSRDETARLLELLDLEPAAHMDVIMARTEGWPAGIYLTALAIRAGAPSPDVHGDDIFLADYLKQELLDPVPEETMTFLLETSILTRLSGSLCDHLLDTTGSAGTLSQLEAANLLIVPVDRTRTWYRYHSLLKDYLYSELTRSNPEVIPTLHMRAATWFEAQGYTEMAIRHFEEAGDSESLARVIQSSIRDFYARGRVETVMSWLASLEQGKELASHPELAALGSFARSLDGDFAGAERMARDAFTDLSGHVRRDSALGPIALMVRSYRAERGIEQALEDARSARALIKASDTQWLHTIMGAEALATQARDGIEATEPVWADGLSWSEGLDAGPFTSAALAQRALVALGRDDWQAARDLITRSLEVIEEKGLESYITSALSYSLAARLASRQGDIEGARAHLASAARIRPRLTAAVPLLAVQNLHEMARAFIEVADIAGARRVMRDAADIIAVRPRLGTLITDHHRLREQLSELPSGSVGASSLTRAELRLLPLLVTHLTYPEIGERLFISRHTVKTQAMSIYRKLGVSSRAEAVATAREVGLLSV